jgi:hypothetical protein
MNAPEEPAGRSVSQESWQAAPVTDPNAALWASITPPANPSLQTLVRRRIESFSLELLAQRLSLRYPSVFRSRVSAQNGILAGVVALGAGAGLLGYFAIGALLDDSDPARVATGARSAQVTAERPAAAALPAATAAAVGAAPRRGESLRASDTPTLAATAQTTSTEQAVQALETGPALDDDVAPVKPKRATASKHKRKSKAKAKARSRTRRNADSPPRNAKARALARMLGN